MATPALVIARRLVVAFMVIALALSGAGRGLTAAPIGAGTATIIAGHVVSLCVTDADDGSGTGDSRQHGCDQCPLCAPVVLPQAPTASQPVPIERTALRDPAPMPTPHFASPRSPRQSQGPPVA